MDAIIAQPRGVGAGSGTSLVTGEPVSHGPDLSMFVASRADAYRLVDWVTPTPENVGGRRPNRIDRAYVDYRTFEPHWLQVKLVVEPEHRDVLERLYAALVMRDYYLDQRLIQWAIDPGHNWDVAKGYQSLYPNELKAAVEAIKARTESATAIIA